MLTYMKTLCGPELAMTETQWEFAKTQLIITMITNPNCFTIMVSEQKYQVNAKNFSLMETSYTFFIT